MTLTDYRLPTGQIVRCDASATKYAPVIDFTLADGTIVQATRVEAPAIDARTRAKLLHVLTVADRRQKSNPYALAHYCGALQSAEAMMIDDGLTLREALMRAFCGPLVNRLVKGAGLPALTESEIRQVR